MTGEYRLPPSSGERVDRSRSVRFTFEGREFEGFAGDTVASALAANGVSTLSRSFKYRRPRGIFSLADRDTNALVQLPGEPNVPAAVREIEDGMEVLGQNYAGSLERDRGAWIGLFSRFLPVGFYYKAFYRPSGAWQRWEPVFRARAGLGAVDPAARPARFDKKYGYHDAVVVGAGPAGLAAAAAAAAAGADVLLVDDQPAPGGTLTHARFGVDRAPQEERLRALVAAVEEAPNVEIATGAVCEGWFADDWLAVVQGRRLHKVRAKRTIVATGAMEQPVVFRNNDLPGIVLPSAAQRLIRHYGVRPGNRAVVVTAGRDGYAAALDLLDAGVDVAAIVDLRQHPDPSPEASAVAERRVRIIAGHTPSEARGHGRTGRVRALKVSPIAGTGRFGTGGETIACDLVCMSAGTMPAAQIACHAGARLVYDRTTSGLRVDRVPHGILVAGAANGRHGLEPTIADGRRAGRAAAAALGLEAEDAPAAPAGPGRVRNHAWPIFPHRRGKEFVDFDEDLTVRDLTDAVDEGYDDIELVKRYSTVGMGPSQGRHSATNALRIASGAGGGDRAEIGTTTVRPPVSGEKLGVLAGRSFEPVRLTPMHRRHVEAGARTLVAGDWLRPAFYGPETERDRLIEEEAAHVRAAVGLIDVSTLGGIEIRGPDAAAFLERMYTFAYRRQPVGRLRYVLMCDAAGTIVDDGVACRLGEEHFYVTATTGGADRVHREMLWHNAQWRLDVDIANVTAAWCGANVAGPLSRETLGRIAPEIDLSTEAFPYLGVREGRVADIPARLLRVGFVGELGYEIHVPAGFGEALWDRLMEAGAADGIRPFGVEAQRLLRLEKGHIIVGQDTDGLTTPMEAGMEWAVRRGKPFFVGGRALDVHDKTPLARKLAGFVLSDADAAPPEECCLVIRDGEIAGRVTSAMRSPHLGRVVGLAFLLPGDAEPGDRFEIRRSDGGAVSAEVAPLPFYDPDNARQEA
ncbi:MAG: 2Fe-2S iron-sulfur cluster-binding protein [Defluviicoccus sp.]|nr:2Fe-2S iron-sulfur cluster-binding protein [Defluviicoccus sp.]MDE0278091.1 2Fe-2S iron-sulfur cluster-binding protein [Defluviicoccus sp.]